MWLARLHARMRNSKELHKRDCMDLRMLSCTRVQGCMDMCTLCGDMGASCMFPVRMRNKHYTELCQRECVDMHACMRTRHTLICARV